MVDLKFQGLKTFDFYDVAVTQVDAQRVAKGYEGQAPGAGTVQISLYRSVLGVAPEGIGFTATATGDIGGPDSSFVDFGDDQVFDPRFHEIHYKWDFGDVTARFTHPVNLADAKNNSNIAHGPIVQHTFKIAGTYTVTCTATNPRLGISRSATLEITVASPETVFSGGDTFFIDPSGSFADAPAGAIPYTDFNTALAATEGTPSPKRLMCAWGSSHDVVGEYIGSGFPSLHVCPPATGSGPRPILNWAPGGEDGMFRLIYHGMGKDFNCYGIHGQGPWDTTTESGETNADFILPSLSTTEYIHLHNCTFDGFRDVSTAVSTSHVGRKHFYNDNLVTNWRNFAISNFSKTSSDLTRFFALVGNNMSQNVNALVGTGSKASKNVHGPVRIAEGDLTCIHQNDMFSRTGWSGLGNGFRAIQPCIRWNTNEKKGARGNIQDNTCEGGNIILELGEDTDGELTEPQNLLIDGNILIGNHQTSLFVAFGSGGITMRNNLCIRPDAQSIIGSGDPSRSFDTYKASGATSAARSAPVRIHHNTFVNLMSDGKTASTGATMSTDNPGTLKYSIADNILHQPNLDWPDVQYAPLTVSDILAADGLSNITPRCIGYRDENFPTPITGTATPSDTVKAFVPAASSIAQASADGPHHVIEDLNKQPRPADKSRGAFDP